MRISDWSSDVCSSDLVAARLLAERGAAVRVAALGEPATDLAKAARAGWSGPVERLDGRLAPAPLIVDALFGVGLSRPIADELAAILGHFADRRTLAVDVPSGIDSDGTSNWRPPLPADEIGRASCRDRVCRS